LNEGRGKEHTLKRITTNNVPILTLFAKKYDEKSIFSETTGTPGLGLHQK
jgi:hypothetical protein